MNKKEIIILCCMSKNGIIGHKNKIPWIFKNDLKRFKEMTIGHSVIMGRKTFDSLPRALPNRTNIIISNNTSPRINAIVTNSLTKALEIAEKKSNKIYIIGGRSIYLQSKNIATQLDLTIINKEVEGDTKFPISAFFDNYRWTPYKCEHHFTPEFEHTIINYKRK